MATGEQLKSLNEFTTFLLDYAVVLAALGALTMALQEAWKKLRDSKAKYHRAAVLRWLSNDQGSKSDKSHYRVEHLARRSLKNRPPFDPEQCYEELLQLTTGLGPGESKQVSRFESSNSSDQALFGAGSFNRSIEYALFELDLDRMMGQIQEAGDVALNNPGQYPNLFMFLTRGARREDVEAWWKYLVPAKAVVDKSKSSDAEVPDLDRMMSQIQAAADMALNNPEDYQDLFRFLTRSAREEDVEAWRKYLATEKSVADKPGEPDPNAPDSKELAERYTRIKQAVRRHLDGFQIVTAMRWREWNQFAALVLGASLMLLAQNVEIISAPIIPVPSKLESTFLKEVWPSSLGMIVLSLLGGILAPIAKDLVDALNKVKP